MIVAKLSIDVSGSGLPVDRNPPEVGEGRTACSLYQLAVFS